MTIGEEYRRDLDALVKRIGVLDPPDLADRFATCFGIDAGSFRQVRPSRAGTVAAVDGSNAMLLDGGSLSVAVIRAAASGFSGDARSFRSVTPLRLVTLGQEARDGSYAALYRECFGEDPEATVRDDEPQRTAAVMRDTLEYWAAIETAGRLGRGDLLVLDGALRVAHASHDPVLVRLIQVCAKRGVHLCAVTKRTAVTWGGGLPLVPAALSYARAHAISPPWVLRIHEEGLDVAPYHQWRHGATCIAALHPGSDLAFKVEVPAPTGDDGLGRVISLLAGWSDDGRLTGYPYPLLDAHLAARISADTLMQVKNDLLAGLGETGLDSRRFDDLFGDIHDAFARY